MNKKGFTLIELLAVIVILAIIALIVTPIVSNIVNNARISANARSVEGHIRNVELAIISNAFASGRGDTDTYDNVTSGTELEGYLTRQDNDNVTCETYSISHGTVLSATNCRDSEGKWSKAYNYTNANGAVVADGSSVAAADPYSMDSMCPGCVFYSVDSWDDEYESYEAAVAANLEWRNEFLEENEEYEGEDYLLAFAFAKDEDDEEKIARAFVCGSANGIDPFCLEASNNDEGVIARNISILEHFFDFDNECTYDAYSIVKCNSESFEASVAKDSYYGFADGWVQMWSDSGWTEQVDVYYEIDGFGGYYYTWR